MSSVSVNIVLLILVLVQGNNSSLYPVPIRILSTPDSYPTVLSLSTSKYYRRFTLVDRMTGVQGGALKYLRVPTSIQFWFRSVGSAMPGQMFIPIMDISYTDIPVSALPKATSDFNYPVSVRLIFCQQLIFLSLPFQAHTLMISQALIIQYKSY